MLIYMTIAASLLAKSTAFMTKSNSNMVHCKGISRSISNAAGRFLLALKHTATYIHTETNKMRSDGTIDRSHNVAIYYCCLSDYAKTWHSELKKGRIASVYHSYVSPSKVWRKRKNTATPNGNGCKNRIPVFADYIWYSYEQDQHNNLDTLSGHKIEQRNLPSKCQYQFLTTSSPVMTNQQKQRQKQMQFTRL